MNTSLVVHVHKDGDKAAPESYPLPHEKGVIKAFDSPADLNPRFGRPSAVLITELKRGGSAVADTSRHRAGTRVAFTCTSVDKLANLGLQPSAPAAIMRCRG